jgi:hypothetical protein
MNDLNTQVERLERRTRRLESWLGVSVALWILTVGAGIFFSPFWGTQAQTAGADTLRASDLIIVDKKGQERVRIGGDLPDAIIGGKKVPRGQRAAGVLLYDASGNERSGYVTFEPSGNVGLTLDSRKSQVASFVAAAEDDASALSLWSGKSLLELRSDDEGSRLTAVRDGQVVVQEPAIKTMSADMCGAYKEALARVSPAQVMSDCRKRFTETACKACLDKK